MDEIEMIQLENMIGYFEKEPESARKHLVEAKELHKDYIENGGAFVEDNYNDMKAYALDNINRFNKIVKSEIRRLPAACKKTAEYKEALANYKAIMAELFAEAEAFEIEEPVVEEDVVEETSIEEGVEEMELVEKIVEEVATTEFDSSDKCDLVEALCDARDVVAGVLEGAYEPERVVQKAHDVIWIMKNAHSSGAKEILYTVETWLCEFYYGETSGEDVYRMITKILVALVGPAPEDPTPDGPESSDSDDVVEIDRALIEAYDAVDGVMNNAYDKSVVPFVQNKLSDKARAFHSRELKSAARLLCEFYFGACDGRKARNKLIVLRHDLLFGGDADEIKHHSLSGRCRPSGTCNERQRGA